MNPLSPLTYYRRHKRRTILLVSLVILATLGLYVMVGLLDSLLNTAAATNDNLTRFALVTPNGGRWVEPALVSQIRTYPDVERAISARILEINVPTALEVPLNMLGLPEADIPYMMQVCDVRLKEGRLLRPRTNEIVLSEEVAKALGLRLGDRISRSINKQYFPNIPTELVLVGILEGVPSASPSPRVAEGERQVGRSVRMGLMSYEYLDSHELYASQPSVLVVVARQGRKAPVDRFLESALPRTQVTVWTYGWLFGILGRVQLVLRLILAVVDCLAAFVIALVVAVIHQIALTQRLEEFGLLHAVGQNKNRLIRRVTLETVILVGVGWMAGLALAWLSFAWLKTSVYDPQGMELNLANPAPFWFTLPIPLAVVAFVTFGITRVLARLDAIAIIERGKLSLETKSRRKAMERSSARPLSSWTFYVRHRRRGLMLVATMALIILGVAFPMFALAPTNEAQKLFIEYMRHVSVVSSTGSFALDPGVVAQVKAHPTVGRVIQARQSRLALSVPPVSETFMTLYAVAENDLPYLVDLCGARLQEGRLPRARTNEVVVSEAVARNRGLSVGSKIGRPIHERDTMPTELVVVGILGPDDLWLGFSSYEYQQSHELYALSLDTLLVVPTEGRKAEMDAWLQSLTSARTDVFTYDVRLRELEQSARGSLLIMAAFEALIAILAAITLAALNYVFFSQRRDEFGILHAMGRGRLWLILRAVKETASVAAVAWLIGAAVCWVAIFYAQANIYAPVGVKLDLFDPGPWVFTFPIPVTVITVSAATIAWMLSRLDPVTIMEREL